MVKKVIIGLMILGLGYGIYRAIEMNSVQGVIEETVEQCTVDMNNNSNLVCD